MIPHWLLAPVQQVLVAGSVGRRQLVRAWLLGPKAATSAGSTYRHPRMDLQFPCADPWVPSEAFGRRGSGGRSSPAPGLHTRECVCALHIVQPCHATLTARPPTPSHEKRIFQCSMFNVSMPTGLGLGIYDIVKHITKVSSNAGFSATVYNQ